MVVVRQYSCATLTLGTIGSLSDYTGRRLTMALSLVGQLVQTGVVLVVAMAGPGMAYRTALYLIYAGTVVTGLSGSYGTFLMVSQPASQSLSQPVLLGRSEAGHAAWDPGD